jgi:hypothetical protein
MLHAVRAGFGEEDFDSDDIMGEDEDEDEGMCDIGVMCGSGLWCGAQHKPYAAPRRQLHNGWCCTAHCYRKWLGWLHRVTSNAARIALFLKACSPMHKLCMHVVHLPLSVCDMAALGNWTLVVACLPVLLHLASEHLLLCVFAAGSDDDEDEEPGVTRRPHVIIEEIQDEDKQVAVKKLGADNKQSKAAAAAAQVSILALQPRVQQAPPCSTVAALWAQQFGMCLLQ